MSLFPYNTDRADDERQQNGSPLTYSQAWGIADQIRMWHFDKRTDHWSQSGDGFDEDVREIALGLMSFFSDPGAIRRLMCEGAAVEKHLGYLFGDEVYEGTALFKYREAIEPLFIRKKQPDQPLEPEA